MSLIHSEYPAFRIPEPATKIVTSSASSIISAISPVTNTISPVTAVSFTLNSTVEHYSKHLVSSTVPPVTEPNKINNNNPIVIIILLSIITLFSTISFVSLLYCCYQFKFLWRPLSKRKNIKLIAPLGTDQTKQANNLENKTSEEKEFEQTNVLTESESYVSALSFNGMSNNLQICKSPTGNFTNNSTK